MVISDQLKSITSWKQSIMSSFCILCLFLFICQSFSNGTSQETCQGQKRWFPELLELPAPEGRPLCEVNSHSGSWEEWGQNQTQHVILITVHCVGRSEFSENVGTTPFKDQLTDNIITKTAMENGVLPHVHITNTLCCNTSVQDAGTDDTKVYNATNGCTVSGELGEIHTTGQLAAYHEERQCIITPKLSSSSSTSEILGGIEAGWLLGWIVGVPVQFSSRFLHLRIEESHVYNQLPAHRCLLGKGRDDVLHSDMCSNGSHDNVLSNPCDQADSNCIDRTSRVCQLIGSVSLGLNERLAVVKTTDRYVVLEYNYGLEHWAVRSELPLPISTSDSTSKNETWTLLVNTNTTDSKELCISDVYQIGSHFLILVGKQLLVSFDKGQSFYLREGLQSTNLTEVVFILIGDTGFLLGGFRAHQGGNQSLAMWYGNVATGDLFPIYPHEHNPWWTVDEMFVTEHAQCHIDIRYHGDALYIQQQARMNSPVHCNRTQQIPLTMLVASSYPHVPLKGNTNNCVFTENNTEFGHWWSTLEECPHISNNHMVGQCPVHFVTVNAPACEKYTRTQFKFADVEWGPLKHMARWDTYKRNCSLPSPSLPPQLFLTPSQTYTFTAHYYLNKGYKPSDVNLQHMSVPENVLDITATRMNGNHSDIVEYEVTIAAMIQERQYHSGTINTGVHVMFKLFGVGLGCMEYGTGQIKDILQTTVYIGCPPRLRIQFSPVRSTAGQRHYCTSPGPNITCLYYEKEFYPKFEVVDEISGERTLFTGHYTIRTLGGGRSPQSLAHFDKARQLSFLLDSGSIIWAPLEGSNENPIFTSSSSGIQWICGPSSPCAGIQGEFPNSPQYTLLLEFTNKGLLEGEYNNCVFSTQFVIVLHGIAMGIGSAVSSLLVSLVIFAMTVAAGFVCWKYKHFIKRKLLSLRKQLHEAYHRGMSQYGRIRERLRQNAKIHPE